MISPPSHTRSESTTGMQGALCGEEGAGLNDLPDPPYPADTRAKGWRFELDYERIEQSDTWSLAAEIPMAQHALLMLWLVAWTQVPCGSLPSDEAIVRAKCRIPPSTWAKCSSLLMRGWIQSSDGRLYHPTITARVVEMMERRRSESDRKAAARARKPADGSGTPGAVPPDSSGSPTVVPPLSRGTDAGLHPESDTGTGTGTSKEKNTNTPPTSSGPPAAADDPARLLTAKDLIAAGIDRKVAGDWLKVRRAKKAPLTQTAWNGVQREVEKAGMALPAAIRLAAESNWAGFKGSWLLRDDRNGHAAVGDELFEGAR